MVMESAWSATWSRRTLFQWTTQGAPSLLGQLKHVFDFSLWLTEYNYVLVIICSIWSVLQLWKDVKAQIQGSICWGPNSKLLSSWLEYDVHQGWSVMVIDGYHWSSMVIDSQQVGRRSNDWPAYCQRRRRIRRCRRPKKSGEIATDGQEDHLDMYKIYKIYTRFINRQKKLDKISKKHCMS